MLNAITVAKAISASGQHVAQLFKADGAKQSPIAMMIGPVTTGGNNFITLLIPTILITAARIT